MFDDARRNYVRAVAATRVDLQKSAQLHNTLLKISEIEKSIRLSRLVSMTTAPKQNHGSSAGRMKLSVNLPETCHPLLLLRNRSVMVSGDARL